MKFLMSEEKPMCIPGWPQPHGYPLCDAPTGGDFALIRPNSFANCPPLKPATIDQISGIRRRPGYRDAVPKPKGVHSFYNLMWDGRIRRGDPLYRSAKKEEEEIQKILAKLNEPRSKASRFHPKSHSLNTQQMDAAQALQAEATRVSKLAINSLIPIDKTVYFAEINDFIDDTDPCYKGRRLQPLRTFPVAPSLKCDIVDVDTQIWPGDFFDFDVEAVPVVETLLGSVFQRAHMELLEEDEITTHRIQIQNNRIKKEAILENIERLREREAKRAAEEERLAQAELDALNNLTDEKRRYRMCTTGGAVTQAAILSCMDELKAAEEEALMWHTAIRVQFVSWLNDGVTEEVRMNDLCRQLLDAMLLETVDGREAEYAEAYWRDLIEEAKLRDKQEETYPPTPGTSVFEGEGGDG